jgi:hypothetical protein
MAIEEARNTEVSITKTERVKYGNAHTIYDMNGGLIDSILEVVPTAEQKAEGVKTLQDSQTEQEHVNVNEGERSRNQRKAQAKISRRRMRNMHTIRTHLETTARARHAKSLESRQKARCNCQANPRGTSRNEVYYDQRSILIQDLAGQVQ